MKNEKLHCALTDIDDDLIIEADGKRKKSNFIKYASVAAALALVIGIVAAVTALRSVGSRYSVTDMDISKYKTVLSDDRNVVFPEKKETGKHTEELCEKYNGFIALITPVEYRFYYVIREDENDGEPYVDGYAECICKINKTSERYNEANVIDGGNTTVRIDLCLSPSDKMSEKTLLDMMTEMGAYKNGKVLFGTYKIPAKYVNENDFEIITHDPRGALPLNVRYLALIIPDNNNGNGLFCYVCPTEDKTLDGLAWDDDIKHSARNFRAFVLENDESMAQ